MLPALAISVLSAVVPVGARSLGAHPSPKPVVRVWLKGGERRTPGDRVRVYFKSERDGYALVLHVEPDGRVRVLFPLESTDDNRVRRGKTYEARSRGDRDAFTVHDSGTGTVYLAVSPQPFQFDSLVRTGHWDYGLNAFKAGGDPEADLTELARLLATSSQFDYDLVRYDVSNGYAYRRYPRYFDPWGWGWYPWRSRFGIGFGWPGYYGGWWGVPWRRIW